MVAKNRAAARARKDYLRPMKATPHRIPAKWAWHHRTLLALRERLREECDEHSSAMRASLEKGGSDSVDLTNDRLEHDALFAALAAEENELAEVDAALQRLQDGTYGVCLVTGKPIGAARLRALPWTRFSQAVAARREAARALKSDFLKV